MTSTASAEPGKLVLLYLAALVVIVAGLKAASPLVVPFLCAVVVAVLASPPVFWLHRHRFPLWLAVGLVVLGLVAIEIALVGLIGSTLNDFLSTLPNYQEQLQREFAVLLAKLGEHGIDTSGFSLAKLLDPGKAMGLTANLVSGLTSLLGNTVLILFTVVFLLLETAGFPAKIRAAGRHAPLDEFAGFARGLNRYLVIKSLTSFGTGMLTTLLLTVLGVPHAILWGVLTFFLHFIPNIGSIIAAVPPVLLAMVDGGLGTALIFVGGALTINLVVGNIVEPHYLGRGLGLSTLVVFLSLVFWGWIFGAIGMLLSVPLTMALKTGCEMSPVTRWIAVLLGPEVKETT